MKHNLRLLYSLVLTFNKVQKLWSCKLFIVYTPFLQAQATVPVPVTKSSTGSGTGDRAWYRFGTGDRASYRFWYRYRIALVIPVPVPVRNSVPVGFY